MELAIPLIALGSLYVVSNQKKEPKESFKSSLPNTDIPNKNFPEEFPIVSPEYDLTSKLSTTNKYDTPHVYTDKYWGPNSAMAKPQIVHHQQNTTFTSLTGDRVDQSYYKHNNMVPFFGSKLRNQQVKEKSNESILDNMVGTGSQINNKKEVSPLFSPSDNMQWAYGMPSSSDFIQSRMNVSQRMAGVKPFVEERVKPGLGSGESIGYNSGMMARESWLPKTADELRVSNKPKASSLMAYGHEGPAMSRVGNMGFEGIVEKNRPERAFEHGPERYLTTTGAYLAPTMPSMPVDREDFINRATTSTGYVGAAGRGDLTETYKEGEYMPSKHIDLGPSPMNPMSAAGRGNAFSGEYGMSGKHAYPNNRTTTDNGDYFGAIGSSVGAVVAPLLDILRPSRKQNTIGSLRPYQNPKSEVNATYVFDPNDKPNPTIRETTENSVFHLNMDRGQHGDGYQVTPHQLLHTARTTTDDFYYSGTGVGPREMRNYDAEYNQRNNEIKSSTIEGRMVPGNMSLLNADINMRTKTLDHDLKNTRQMQPTMPYQSPNVESMGHTMNNTRLYANMGLDRNQPDMLSALNSNPYAQNIMNLYGGMNAK